MAKPTSAGWSRTVPVGDRRVYFYERTDRNNALCIKFTSPAKSGRDRRVTRKLPDHLRIRDARGRIDRQMEREVLQEVARLAIPLLHGEAPDLTPNEAPLTLGDGFARALSLEGGKYATTSRRWDEVHRGRRRLERILGATCPMAEISAADVRGIWRTLARDYVRSDSTARLCGARQAEVTVDALYSVAAWLRDEGILPANTLQPITKWRSKLKKEWAEISGAPVKPSQPRHSESEMRKLFAHMHNADVDPRFALAFDIGGEQRIGQVLRARRSDLELPESEPSTERTADCYFGVLRPQGSGNKMTSPIVLSRRQRIAVDRALSGYLSKYEEAYTRGEIADYFLFPSQRLKQGKAKVVASPRPLTRDAARGMFRALEEIAGVESVHGRGWYGVRRVATDVAEDYEKDERVLNSITGHRDSATRRLIYQQGERSTVLQQAAITREKIRALTLEEDVTADVVYSAV